ncbi:hypothetical protein ABBQ38_014412 [Trebouxia sp. C0009 RCD-2024]
MRGLSGAVQVLKGTLHSPLHPVTAPAPCTAPHPAALLGLLPPASQQLKGSNRNPSILSPSNLTPSNLNTGNFTPSKLAPQKPQPPSTTCPLLAISSSPSSLGPSKPEPPSINHTPATYPSHDQHLPMEEEMD